MASSNVRFELLGAIVVYHLTTIGGNVIKEQSPIYNRDHLYQYRWLALAFTFCGGYIDAYTYGLRGNTLAAGQTGNIIFFSVELAQHNLPGLVTKLWTFVAFI